MNEETLLFFHTKILQHLNFHDKIENLTRNTVKILKFGTPQTIAIIVLKIEKFDVTLH